MKLMKNGTPADSDLNRPLLSPVVKDNEPPEPTPEPPAAGFWSIYSKFATPLDWLLIFFGFITGIASGTLQPIMALILGRVFGGRAGISSVALKNQIDESIPTFLYLAGAAFVLFYVQTACFMISSERMVLKIKASSMRSILSQEIGYYDTNAAGKLASSLSEQGTMILQGTGQSFAMTVQFSAQFVSGFAIAFWESWEVAVAMLVCMPIITFTCAVMIFYIIKYIKKGLEAYEEAGDVADEILSSIQTVASFGGEPTAVKRYDAKLKVAETAGVKLGLVRGIGMGLTLGVVFMSFGLGYWWGAQKIAEGKIDFGKVLSTVTAAIIGSISIGIAVPNMSAMAQAKAAAEILFKVIDRETLIDADAPGTITSPPHGGKSLRGDVHFESVSFRYPARPESLALQDFELVIPAGSTVALVGASGCGKSTCIQLLERFYDVERGAVKVDGVDVRDFNLNWLRSQIALVGQEPVLFDDSVAENVRYGKQGATLAEVEAACKSSNAHDFISLFPDGYGTAVGARGSKLSGGQKQRVAIARALIKDPAILLLDEATSALDNESERVVQEAIDQMITDAKKTGRNRTTIVIAHRLTTIRNADMIVVLDNDGEGGYIAEKGTHDELMASVDGAYAQLIKLQEKKKPAAAAVPTRSRPPPRSRRLQQQRRSSASAGGAKSPKSPMVQESPLLTAADAGNTHGLAQSPLPSEAASLLRSAGMGSRRSSSLAGAALEHVMQSPSEFSLNGEADDAVRKPPPARSSMDLEEGGDKEGEEEEEDDVSIPWRRLWGMSAPEKWWYGVGAVGATLKGASQPSLAIIISIILQGLVLVPNISGTDVPTACNRDSDCADLYGSEQGICFDLGLAFGDICTDLVTGAECEPGSGPTCICLSDSFPDLKICADGYDPEHGPDQVRDAGIVALWGYAILASAAGIGVLLQSYSFVLIGERLLRRLRALTFASVTRQDSPFFDDDNNSVGTLLTRLATDATLVKEVTGEFTGRCLENLVALVTAFGIAFQADVQMTSVVMIAGMPLLVFSAYVQHRAVIGRNKTSIESQKASGKLVSEAIAGVRTVYSFAAQGTLLDMYTEALQLPKRAGIANAHVCGLGAGVAQFLFFSVYAFAFWYGGVCLERDDPISVQSLSRVFFALTMSATTVGQAVAEADNWTKGKIATASIFRLADLRTRIDPSSETGTRLRAVRGRIEFAKVGFRYPTRPRVPILREFSTTILAGQTVAFVGASGSGKSSLIRLLERFYDIDDDGVGRILIDGVDLRSVNLKWWRAQVGLVGQEPVLFRGSVAENVLYGAEAGSSGLREVEAACRSSNAHDFIEAFPAGYRTEVGGKGTMLSGGQKQRVAIARALIKDPAILLLDEATSALDNESEALVQAALDRLMATSERTTIVVAHRLSTIQNSDKIIVIDNADGEGGRLVEQGTHEELMSIEGGSYKHLQSMTVRT